MILLVSLQTILENGTLKDEPPACVDFFGLSPGLFQPRTTPLVNIAAASQEKAEEGRAVRMENPAPRRQQGTIAGNSCGYPPFFNSLHGSGWTILILGVDYDSEGAFGRILSADLVGELGRMIRPRCTTDCGWLRNQEGQKQKAPGVAKTPT